jgi:Domain of unknown function (DUF4410)
MSYRLEYRRLLKRSYLRASLLSLLLILSACRTAQISDRRELSAQPTAKPAVIYVTDFELDAQNIESEPGLLPESGGLLPRPGILSRLTGRSESPADRARELVDRMSNSLVKDLNDADISARRFTPGEPFPPTGWVVRGVFTEVQEGNRLRRAVIGFGVGKTELQVLVYLDDLADGVPRPFAEFDTSVDSGDKPGGAKYAAGVKYALGRFDLDKNVEQTASAIAADINQRIQKQAGSQN